MMRPNTLENRRYELLSALGEGGMAYVFRALDTRLKVERAVKILAPRLVMSPKIRSRFEVEAMTMAQLHHKNIVTVHDIGYDKRLVYMVMEMLRGGSLMDRIEKHGALHPRLAIDAAIEITSGLGYAHENKVVHRDVKPHNVLISRDGILKVADFGIARIEDGHESQTRTGAVMGSLAYMAPEQKLSARRAEARSDLYAVAASFYVMLTSKSPFELYSEDVQEDMLKELPMEIAHFIKKGCHFDRKFRFQNAQEMIEALESLKEHVEPVSDEALPLYIQQEESSNQDSLSQQSLNTMWNTLMSELSSADNQSESSSQPEVMVSSETIDFDLFGEDDESSVSSTKENDLPSKQTSAAQQTVSFSDISSEIETPPSRKAVEKPTSPPAPETVILQEAGKKKPPLGMLAGVLLVVIAAVTFLLNSQTTTSTPAENAKEVTTAQADPAPTATTISTKEKVQTAAQSKETSDPPNRTTSSTTTNIEKLKSENKTKTKTKTKTKISPPKEDTEGKNKNTERGYILINARPLQGAKVKINGTSHAAPLLEKQYPVGTYPFTISWDGNIHKGKITVSKDKKAAYCWNFKEGRKC